MHSEISAKSLHSRSAITQTLVIGVPLLFINSDACTFDGRIWQDGSLFASKVLRARHPIGFPCVHVHPRSSRSNVNLAAWENGYQVERLSIEREDWAVHLAIPTHRHTPMAPSTRVSRRVVLSETIFLHTRVRTSVFGE